MAEPGSGASGPAGGGAVELRDCDGVFRCLCGSLLARRVPGGIELKCRRCKRTAIVPLASEEPGTSD